MTEHGTVVVKLIFDKTEIQAYFDWNEECYKLHVVDERSNRIYRMKEVEDIGNFLELICPYTLYDIEKGLYYYNNNTNMLDDIPICHRCFADDNGVVDINEWIELTKDVY